MQLLKTIGVMTALYLAWVVVIPGIFWSLAIFKRTGYRSRDLLMLLIPFYCWVVTAKTTWRYVSPTRYWEAPFPV